MTDDPFKPHSTGLLQALELLRNPAPGSLILPDALPEVGAGERAVLNSLAPGVLGGAADLGAPHALAHMDPPTPWITWAVTQWTASLNQNLLHPATSPVAGDIEARVIDWLCPFFGMSDGHMLPGSTLANLTALWAAREIKGIRRVIASEAAHLSVRKAAHILGLDYQAVPTDQQGAMRADALPDLADCALVLTAGTTNAGAIDPLDLRAAWTHVDAAWAGPLRLTRYAERLAGLESADSISISAHKWLFQPKESALILFRDAASKDAISFGGAYLTTPNIGLLGSHGANAVPLLATLMAWGREGIAARIEASMAIADRLADWAWDRSDVILYGPNRTGLVLWRPSESDARDLLPRLPSGSASLTTISGTDWVRNVAANPGADIAAILQGFEAALTQP